MQGSLGFAAADIARWRALLARRFGRLGDVPRRQPIGQLVKSLISSRTRDAVSLAAYRAIGRRWGAAATFAQAPPAEIEQTIAAVTFAEAKAAHLSAAFAMIRAERPDFRLDFLGRLSLPAALAWLDRLPGVGRKVAAATLNASTLARPVFIVDSHVHRVLVRLGFVARTATPSLASEKVTALGLDADALLEPFAHMKHLGQTVCRFDAPLCDHCPLAAYCPKVAWP